MKKSVLTLYCAVAFLFAASARADITISNERNITEIKEKSIRTFPGCDFRPVVEALNIVWKTPPDKTGDALFAAPSMWVLPYQHITVTDCKLLEASHTKKEVVLKYNYSDGAGEDSGTYNDGYRIVVWRGFFPADENRTTFYDSSVHIFFETYNFKEVWEGIFKNFFSPVSFDGMMTRAIFDAETRTFIIQISPNTINGISTVISPLPLPR